MQHQTGGGRGKVMGLATLISTKEKNGNNNLEQEL